MYKKLLDIENQKENPFNTAVGQEVTSVEENFWSRKLRYGKTAFKLYDGIALPASGTFYNQFYIPKVDKIFIPKTLSWGSDVDCVFRITYLPYANYDPYDATLGSEYLINTFIPAKTPFIYNFDGQLEILAGGNLGIQVIPKTTGGTAYFNFHGIEVSRHA